MPRPQAHPCRPELCGLVTDTNSTVGAVVPDAPLAVPSCPGSATAANTPSPVGAGSQGTLAGYPARDTLRDHLCLAMAANFPPSVGAGLQGTLAGYPARRNIPLPPPTPQWPRSFPHTSLHSPLFTLHSPPNIPPIPRINTINLSHLRFIPKNALFLGLQI